MLGRVLEDAGLLEVEDGAVDPQAVDRTLPGVVPSLGDGDRPDDRGIVASSSGVLSSAKVQREPVSHCIP